MKYLLILCTIFLVSVASAQWTPVSLGIDGHEAMAVINTDTVIYVSQNGGKIHRSVQGGSFAASFQTPFTSEWFTDITFPTEQVGYACGGSNFGLYTNIILKTTDNGVSWDSLTSNAIPGYSFNHIAFKDQVTGLVYGDGGLYKTTDGGENFTAVVQPDFHQITDMDFSPNGVALIASVERIGPFPSTHISRLFTTVDLGQTYNLIYADTLTECTNFFNRDINDIFFLNESEVFAVGGNGLLLKSMDGGITWNTSHIEPYSVLSTVFFTSSSVGYTNAAGGIFKTTNGGNSWSPQNITPPIVIHQIAFANDQVGYAIGQDGLYRTENAGETTIGISESKLLSSIEVYPNPVEDVIHFTLNEMLRIESIDLFQTDGKLVMSFATNSRTLDIKNVSNGQYFLTIATDHGIITKKVIIN